MISKMEFDSFYSLRRSSRNLAACSLNQPKLDVVPQDVADRLVNLLAFLDF